MVSKAGTVTSDSFVADVIDNGKISGQQVLIVGLCLFFNMLDGFDITAMAVVASPVAAELALTPDRLGWIFSFALAGMMAGAMFLAPVSDVLGRRNVVILALILVGASIILTARATTYAEFIVLRFVSGMGAGALLACQAALAAEYSPEKYRAAAVAIVTSGYPLGAMMTSVVAGYVLPDYGWRGMFWFGGVVTLSMVVVAFLLIPESLKYLIQKRPDNALERVNGILAKMKREPLAALPDLPERGLADDRGVIGNMLKLVSDDERVGRLTLRSATLILWTAFLLCFSTLYFLMSWIPKLMDDSGYDPSVGHDAFFMFNLGGVIGIYLMSYLSTRWKLTNMVFLLSASSAVGMVIFAFAPNQLNLLMTLILLIGILQQGGFTGLYGTAAKLYPTEIRSTGIGWAIGLGRFGAVAGPAVAGYLILAGFDMAANFVFFAVPMAIGGFIAYLLHVD